MYLWYPAFGISWYSAAGTHAALYWQPDIHNERCV